MEITIKEENGVSILNLKGRLDLASGNGLKDQIKNLIEKEKIMIHLNLAEVDFINSSGLG
ncbi:MAG: STAS domain-containing protein, partial [FCB group bacterium]|nr:STAS domain-containing protein [FCB group bacterium]